MSKLLVSVRDVAEARVAIENGVDLVDLKEPNRGALGPVDEATARDVAALRSTFPEPLRRVRLSMALGELTDFYRDDRLPNGDVDKMPIEPPNIPDGIQYAKVGLAGCAKRKHWREQWRDFSRRVLKWQTLVAVIYADHDAVDAPEPDEVLAAAFQVSARAVLIDTAVKDGRTLLDIWSLEQIGRIVQEVRRRSWISVVGGGLTTESIAEVGTTRPNYIAVRGAACRNGRTSTIDAERIQAVRAAIPMITFRT